MEFTSQASCIYCDYPHARTNENGVCKLCYDTLQEDTLSEDAHDSNNYYRPIRRSTDSPDHVTVTSTESSISCSPLEQVGCTACGAAYGHKILCPTFNRNIAEARSAVLNKPDADFLKSLNVTW